MSHVWKNLLVRIAQSPPAGYVKRGRICRKSTFSCENLWVRDGSSSVLTRWWFEAVLNGNTIHLYRVRLIEKNFFDTLR